jgi:hypothetical protein
MRFQRKGERRCYLCMYVSIYKGAEHITSHHLDLTASALTDIFLSINPDPMLPLCLLGSDLVYHAIPFHSGIFPSPMLIQG